MCSQAFIESVKKLAHGKADVNVRQRNDTSGLAKIALTSFTSGASLLSVASRVNDLKEFKDGQGKIELDTGAGTMLISVS